MSQFDLAATARNKEKEKTPACHPEAAVLVKLETKTYKKYQAEKGR